MPETDKSLVGLETTAASRAEIEKRVALRFKNGDASTLEEMLQPYMRDFDRLQASLASMTERAEKAERERDRFADDAKKFAGQAATAEALVEVLEAALKPFAAEADKHNLPEPNPEQFGHVPDDWPVEQTALTFGDLRAARAALSKETSDAG